MDINEKRVDDTHLETSSTEKNINDKDVALGTSEIEPAGYDFIQTKALLRKCDKALLPFLALLYLLSFLDRTNIGNAKLAGLEEDLNMTGKWDYNVSSAKSPNAVFVARR